MISNSPFINHFLGSAEIACFSRHLNVSLLSISLVFSLVRKEQGKVLLHLVQQFCGVSLSLSACVCVNIHCGRHIRMAKKLLHVLRRCAVGQQIAGEGVTKLVEMKALHIVM